MAKRKKNRKTLPDDDATYRLRSGSLFHGILFKYERNGGFRWLNVAAKLAKRRWDPPKRTKTLEAHISTDSDVDTGGVDSKVSGPELLPVHPRSSDVSLATVAILLEEQLTSSSMSIMAEAPNIVARPDSPTPDEHIAVEALASMALFQVEPPLDKERADSILSLAGKLSSLSDSSNVRQPTQRVDTSIQERVAALNAGRAAHPLTALEMRNWTESGRDRREAGYWMAERRVADVQVWCNAVDQTSRSSREDHNLSHFQESCCNEQEFYNYYNT
ncbi:hypothetical protein C8J57DRAFT_1211817 [Mycena rebaudengoi]|nr:hypothetical protein C8J57DRAFT_1211817 [Mycena rebaudengoi]